MKKDTKIYLSLVVIVIIIIAGIYYSKGNNKTPEEQLAKCIGENSELYVQIGCSACKIQEDLFGENYKYLTTIDCYYERELCIKKQITATPTWIINQELYKGVRNIEELKNLTGC